MKKETKICLIVGVIILMIGILYIKGYFSAEFFSGAFDPSSRAGLSGIGPEPFCTACS